jgi:hypothetical protein
LACTIFPKNGQNLHWPSPNTLAKFKKKKTRELKWILILPGASRKMQNQKKIQKK